MCSLEHATRDFKIKTEQGLRSSMESPDAKKKLKELNYDTSNKGKWSRQMNYETNLTIGMHVHQYIQ